MKKKSIIFIFLFVNQIFSQQIIKVIDNYVLIDTDQNIGRLNDEVKVYSEINGVVRNIGLISIVKFKNGMTAAKILKGNIHVGNFVKTDNIINGGILEKNKNDVITINTSIWGITFRRDNKRLNINEVKNILETVTASSDELSIANSIQSTANLFGTIGGALIGWPIGQAIAGKKDINWSLAGIGGAILIPGMILQSNANRHYMNAVNNYNNRIYDFHGNNRISVDLLLSLNQIGLTVRF
jgi:hypothetical protein